MRAARAPCWLAGAGLMLPLGDSGPSQLSVVDGRALVAGGDHAAGHAIDAINFEVGAAGPNGPYTLDGEFVIAAQRFGVTAPSGPAPSGQLEHAATGGDRARGGQQSDHPELPRPDLVGSGGPAAARRPVAERQRRRGRARRARPRAWWRPGRRAAGAARLAQDVVSSGRPSRSRRPRGQARSAAGGARRYRGDRQSGGRAAGAAAGDRSRARPAPSRGLERMAARYRRPRSTCGPRGSEGADRPFGAGGSTIGAAPSGNCAPRSPSLAAAR